MLAYFINAIAAFLINTFFDKVSIHVWDVSGPSVAVFYVLGAIPFAITLIVAAFVCYSRIMLRRHTARQVVLAFLVSLPLLFNNILYAGFVTFVAGFSRTIEKVLFVAFGYLLVRYWIAY